MFGYYKLKQKIKECVLFWNIPKTNNFDFEKRSEELYLFGNGYTLDLNINLDNLNGADIFVCNEIWKHR
jgi:hypothetical protein